MCRTNNAMYLQFLVSNTIAIKFLNILKRENRVWPIILVHKENYVNFLENNTLLKMYTKIWHSLKFCAIVYNRLCLKYTKSIPANYWTDGYPAFRRTLLRSCSSQIQGKFPNPREEAFRYISTLYLKVINPLFVIHCNYTNFV